MSRAELRKAGEFRESLARNEHLTRENVPEAWTYLGTWFTVRSLGKYQCETRSELTYKYSSIAPAPLLA